MKIKRPRMISVLEKNKNQLSFLFKDEIDKDAQMEIVKNVHGLLKLIRYGISRVEEIPEYEDLLHTTRELVKPLLLIMGAVKPISTSAYYDLLSGFLYPTRYTYVDPSKEEVLTICYDIHVNLRLLDKIKANTLTEEQQKTIYGQIVRLDDVDERFIKIIDEEETRLSASIR